MRILLVNKFFHPRAGAETSFLHTRNLLLDHGHDVIDFAMQHSANLSSPYESFFAPERDYGGGAPLARRARDALSAVYSLSARRALGRLLDAYRPDVAHLHNVYHQLTLSVIDELKSRKVPTVMTIHDWKVACPAYTLFTEGAPCRRCPSGTVLHAVAHRCVKGSTAGSALAAAEATLARHRGSYGKVDRFIAPSHFAVDVAALGGIGRDKVTVIPNFLPDDELNVSVSEGSDGPRLLYAGRLEEIKGVRTLLSAFAQVRTQAALVIAGSGPLEGEVRAAAARDSRISYVGMLARDDLYRELEAARAVILPSLYEDNGPLIILEAQARARPMIVTDRGGPREFVRHGKSGLVVRAGDVAELTAAISKLSDDPELAQGLGRTARDTVRRENSSSQHYALLCGVYEEARAQAA